MLSLFFWRTLVHFACIGALVHFVCMCAFFIYVHAYVNLCTCVHWFICVHYVKTWVHFCVHVCICVHVHWQGPFLFLHMFGALPWLPELVGRKVYNAVEQARHIGSGSTIHTGKMLASMLNRSRKKKKKKRDRMMRTSGLCMDSTQMIWTMSCAGRGSLSKRRSTSALAVFSDFYCTVQNDTHTKSVQYVVADG